MTSPKTDHLPIVSAGLIWDGETEYQDTLTAQGNLVIYLVRMYGDRTRRFSEFLGVSNPMTRLLRAKASGWEQIGITFENPIHHLNTRFLGYDGVLSPEPVNQFFQLNQFREHASRFAHQLDDALGHHSLSSASEEDRMVTYQTLSSMIGSGWRRYKVWDATVPEEIIVGGNYDGTLLWKRQRPDYIEIDRLMCGQCDIATFASRFKFQANLPLFRRLYRSGVIYVANRDTTPWDATIFDVATNPVRAFYDNLEVEYHLALRLLRRSSWGGRARLASQKKDLTTR